MHEVLVVVAAAAAVEHFLVGSCWWNTNSNLARCLPFPLSPSPAVVFHFNSGGRRQWYLLGLEWDRTFDCWLVSPTENMLPSAFGKRESGGS